MSWYIYAGIWPCEVFSKRPPGKVSFCISTSKISKFDWRSDNSHRLNAPGADDYWRGAELCLWIAMWMHDRWVDMNIKKAWSLYGKRDWFFAPKTTSASKDFITLHTKQVNYGWNCAQGRYHLFQNHFAVAVKLQEPTHNERDGSCGSAWWRVISRSCTAKFLRLWP